MSMNRKHTDAEKQKISDSVKATWARIGHPRKGMKMPADWGEKRREAISKAFTPARRQMMSDRQKEVWAERNRLVSVAKGFEAGLALRNIVE